jgi:tRNA pseudouridine13 synthase
MYLHAYQSYVWNNAASRRWELHGEKVIKGDLILVEDSDTTNAEPEQDQDGDEVINPNDEEGYAKVHARALTEEEASSGRYSIRDVVLPMPGYEVIYPDNDIGAFYAEFMARPENGGLDPDKMRRIRREFSLPGRYRRLMNRFLGTPSVDVKTYVDDTEQMHPTDLDLVRAASSGKGKRARESSGAAGDGPAGKKFKGDGDGSGSAVEKDEAEAATSEQPEEKKTVGEPEKKIAAVVRFQLGSSAYATVTLRELMGDPPESNTSE